MDPDQELLHRYVQFRSEAAFTELVSRHVNLVYAVALRRLKGHSAIAEDVTQRVFADLARKAPSLVGHSALAAWLYRSARFAAAQAARAEFRRRTREEAAMTMSYEDTPPAGQADLQRMQAQVDDALDGLSEQDRRAIVLRYYTAKSFGEIGRVFDVTEDGARKRVERALEKLRVVLSRRGITSTAAALSVALAGNAATTAPAALGSSVAGAALSSTATTSLWVMLGSYKAAVVGVGVFVTAAGGLAVFQTKQASQLREDLDRVSGTVAALRSELVAAERAAQRHQIHATQAEEDATLLLGVIRQAGMTSGITSSKSDGPLDRAAVEKRYAEARAHAMEGKQAEALEGFLWCFDRGMPAVPSYAGVRLSFLVSEIKKLAAVYPPAMTAIRERRDRAERAMAGEPAENRHAMDFVALNEALGEDERSVEVFLQMSEHDPRRSAMAFRVTRSLIKEKRYAEAANVQTIDGVLLEFERRKSSLERLSVDEKTSAAGRRATIETYAMYVEVMAGANKPEEAQRLIDAMMGWDRSEETTLALREALRRSGRGEHFSIP